MVYGLEEISQLEYRSIITNTLLYPHDDLLILALFAQNIFFNIFWEQPVKACSY